MMKFNARIVVRALSCAVGLLSTAPTSADPITTVVSSQSRDLTGDGVRDFAVFRPAAAGAAAGLLEIESGVDQSVVMSMEVIDGYVVMQLVGRSVPADLNDDQRINTLDLVGMFSVVGQTGPPGFVRGDLDGNGIVDERDIERLISALDAFNWDVWADALTTAQLAHPELFVGGTDRLDPGGCLELDDWVYCGGGGGDPGGGPGGIGAGGGEPGSGGSGGGGSSSVPGGNGPPISGGQGCACNGQVYIIDGWDNGAVVPAIQYAAPGTTVNFNLYFDFQGGCNWTGGCGCPPNHSGPFWVAQWSILSGQQFLTSSSAPYSLKSNGTPGSVTVRYQAQRCDGLLLFAQHTVQFVERHEIQVEYMGFIPCEAVSLPSATPSFVAQHRHYEGDNRTFFVFQPGTYRFRFDQQVRVSDPPVTTELVALPRNATPFGLTKAYDDVDVQIMPVAICPTVLLPTAVVRASDTLAATLDNHAAAKRRIDLSTVKVSYHLEAGMPLASLSPPIWGDLWVELRQFVHEYTGAQSVHYLLRGGHAAYPAHEYYIEGHPVIQYDPVPLGGTPMWLLSWIAAPISYLDPGQTGTIQTH